MIPKFLTLLLIKPQSRMVIVKLREFLPIQVSISAENVDDCFVNFKYNNDCLELVEGAGLNSLGNGSFLKQLSWVLKAIKISDNSLRTEIIAEAGSLSQAASFSIKVIRNTI
jgi:hypothetical protein